MDTWVGNLKGDGQSRTLFYTDPTIKVAFKVYVKIIIDRYRKSPAFFAWELANEVCLLARCIYDPSSSTENHISQDVKRQITRAEFSR